MTIDMNDYRLLQTKADGNTTEYDLVSLSDDKTFVYKSDLSLTWTTRSYPNSDSVLIKSNYSLNAPKPGDALAILRAFTQRPVTGCTPTLRGYEFMLGIKGEDRDIYLKPRTFEEQQLDKISTAGDNVSVKFNSRANQKSTFWLEIDGELFRNIKTLIVHYANKRAKEAEDM